MLVTVNRFATSIDPVHCLVGNGMLDGAGGHPQFRKDGTMRQGLGCCPQSVRYSLPGTVQQMTRFSGMG